VNELSEIPYGTGVRSPTAYRDNLIGPIMSKESQWNDLIAQAKCKYFTCSVLIHLIDTPKYLFLRSIF
jgi:hypothetical protein